MAELPDVVPHVAACTGIDLIEGHAGSLYSLNCLDTRTCHREEIMHVSDAATREATPQIPALAFLHNSTPKGRSTGRNNIDNERLATSRVKNSDFPSASLRLGAAKPPESYKGGPQTSA